MRLIRHLNEQEYEDEFITNPLSDFQVNLFTKYIPMIKKDCRAFLNETKGCKKFLYRGLKLKEDPHVGFEIRTTRQDRRPTDTDKRTQRLFDKAYEQQYGWKPRTTGVFTSNDIGGTYGYGWTHYIFPLGKYNYAWSPDVQDFFIVQGRMKISQTNDIHALGEMMTLVKKYNNSKNLCKILNTDRSHEIILGCKKYYAVQLRSIHENNIEKNFIKALWK